MRLERLTSPAAGAIFAQDPVVLLPLGTVEVHGRHLPLNTDMLAPEYVIDRIEEQLPGVLILPSLHFGTCDTQTEFPGTLSLGPKLLYEVLMKIFESLYRQGARRFAVVNGHGPNSAPLERAALELHRRGAQLAVLNWWRYVWDINPDWRGGHGGGQETSAMLAIAPELVHPDEFEPAKAAGISADMPANGWDNVLYRGVNIPVPRTDVHVTDNGWLGDDPLESASAEQGFAMLQAATDWAVQLLTELKNMELPISREAKA